ncbi:MAG: hypothetical protein HY273_15460 [Gammaproteobacteria bacterium]|nr:hypothetical protein [Gammaproteobacteria bacterium]
MMQTGGQLRLRMWLLMLLGVAWLNGCGKAADTGATDAASSNTMTIALVRSSDGAATTSISSASPGTLKVNIRIKDGSYPQNVVITFATDLGVLNPDAGTALTNSSGNATIQLLSEGKTGAGTVTATAKINGEDLSASLNFSVTSAALAGRSLNLSLKDNTGASTSSVRADAPGTLTATVVDSSGAGVRDVIVVFATDLGALSPSNGTAITNSSGQASIALGFKDALGADTVQATASIGAETLTTTLNYQVAPPAIRLGYTSGSFTQGVVGIGTSPLSPGGTTGITVNIVDTDNVAFSVPIEVSFASSCAAINKSRIDASASTINGQAVVTYQANGCVGADSIVATASFGGSNFSATSNIVVNADTAGSIEFVSATPALIAIRGTGGIGLSETSTVVFRVKSTQGLPVANQLVNFALNTGVGGLALAPISGYSNGSGEISTVVRSGAVATGVRVTASTLASGVTLSSQSNQLTVSTGLPDQNSTGIAASIWNPEAFELDGETIIVSAHLADHFNNPVPDGTAVSFITEGGSIEPSCLTEQGTCSVIWTSQVPRPVDHRVTILMTAVGNESFFDEDGNGSYSDGDGEPYNDANANGVLDEPFTDANSNGIFDEPFTDTTVNGIYDFGEPFVDYNHNGRYDGAGNNPLGETLFVDRNGNGVYDGAGTFASGEAYTDADSSGTFTGPGFADYAEAFLDKNENGVRDQGEPYLDFNNNGQYDLRDGAYSGALCTHTSLCAVPNTVHVRNSIVIVMSGSQPHITVQDPLNNNLTYYSNIPGVPVSGIATPLNIAGGSADLKITLTDNAGQSLPAGTIITISADAGELKGESEITIPGNTTYGRAAVVSIKDDDTASTATGKIKIHVATPKGEITEKTFDFGL